MLAIIKDSSSILIEIKKLGGTDDELHVVHVEL